MGSDLIYKFLTFCPRPHSIASTGIIRVQYVSCAFRANSVEELKLHLTRGRSSCNDFSKYSSRVRVIFLVYLHLVEETLSSSRPNNRIHFCHRCCLMFVHDICFFWLVAFLVSLHRMILLLQHHIFFKFLTLPFFTMHLLFCRFPCLPC